ncbi:hypothetical protein AVEN_247898-1 [Araneus ventricosus]|uniref:Uncharacterized protein n=1 Tax=Araneus ventricosus TaxID=182803 RepID=A0A4Y2P9K6_ARAVE|nr:hypothetical protein AVEN_247898-1 [Araneus ventricosus]
MPSSRSIRVTKTSSPDRSGRHQVWMSCSGLYMKELACLGVHELGGGDSPPPVIVRTSYGRGWAVGLCWPLGHDLSTRRYRTTVIQCSPVCFGRSGAVFTVTKTSCRGNRSRRSK